MATETLLLSREQRQKAIRLRALQRQGNLDKKGQIVLRDLERNGLMPERSILEKLEGQVSGDQGARNLRATGEMVSGAAADATGADRFIAGAGCQQPGSKPTGGGPGGVVGDLLFHQPGYRDRCLPARGPQR